MRTARIASGIGVALGAFVVPLAALAHCPLCTIGAGVAAAGAAWLGVDVAVIGIFIGAFGFAIGAWMGRMLIKKTFFRFQTELVGLLSFLATVLPIRAVLEEGYGSLYISLWGEYGSFLNRTYLIDRFLVGAIVGAFLLLSAPMVSRWVTRRRKGSTVPYQGIIITFTLLVAASLVGQFML